MSRDEIVHSLLALDVMARSYASPQVKFKLQKSAFLQAAPAYPRACLNPEVVSVGDNGAKFEKEARPLFRGERARRQGKDGNAKEE